MYRYQNNNVTVILYHLVYSQLQLFFYDEKYLIAAFFKKLLFFIAINFLFQTFVTAQIPGRRIEINPYVRFDHYPEFSYNYKGRYSTDYLKMQGTSWGIDFNYKIITKRKINYKIGLGYLTLKFSKLTNENSSFGLSDSRPIDYFSPNLPDPVFLTNKYSYNIIPLKMGLEKTFEINNKLNILSGIEIYNFFTFSQSYNIKNHNTTYRRNDKSLFGHSVQLTAGILKQYKKSSIAPLLSVPIYTIWQKDNVFAENEKEKRSKWFNGFSLGFQYNFSIKKNHYETN